MESIEILIDHSYEEDYHMISDVVVNVKDETEKERIENLVEESNMIGVLVDVDNELRKRIAYLLKVNPFIINFDTNEIDF